MSHTLSAIAELLNGEVIGDGSIELNGLASAAEAKDGDLTFAEKDSYLAVAEAGAASAVMVGPAATSGKKALIRVANPRVALVRLLQIFYPPTVYPAGIHPTATVDPTASVAASAYLGPNVVIGPRARVGERCTFLGGNHLGADCGVGDDTCLFPNVVIYAGCQVGSRVRIHAGTVIGADGYGYTFDRGQHLKLLQVGNVVIGDDVEIGANTCIDRAALSSTTVGAGSKIDNLVHVAHNVKIGRHCLIMGQVGFAGSTELGDYAVVASQSGIAGHLKIGRQAVIGAKSGVMRDVPDQTTVLGIPAVADKQAKRQWIATQQLPDLIRRVRDLERLAGVNAPSTSTAPAPAASP
jgi:UDP-3-O-[3-hydroxymyristoyl] glucosamine N-acyltransferase